MANLTETQKNPIVALATILLETVIECGPDGAPAGPTYAAFMQYGFSYDSFMMLIEVLKAAELITYEGHVMKATEKALEEVKLHGK